MTFWWVLTALVLVVVLIRTTCKPEIEACLARDPASRNFLEILLTYSGFQAILAYCLAHPLYLMKIPVLPKLIMTLARWVTGVEVHPGAQISRGFFIDHGMGVVIGETTVIGNNVTLFQGVTLGGTGKERGKRHPTIGNNVVVGAGAKVLGNIHIGNNTVIGANAVVIRDVPQHSTVVGVPGRVTKIKGQEVPGINLDHTHLPDPVADRIRRLQKEIVIIEKHLKEEHHHRLNPPCTDEADS